MRKFLTALVMFGALGACENAPNLGFSSEKDEIAQLRAQVEKLQEAQKAPVAEPAQVTPVAASDEPETHYCTTGVRVSAKEDNERAMKIRSELGAHLADLLCKVPVDHPSFDPAPKDVTITFAVDGNAEKGTARSKEGDEFRWIPSTR